jgi:preprotein translocase subunit SecD
VAPRSRSGSHPGRALAALGVLVLIMLFSITAKQTFSPSDWHSRFKVGLGLDLSSGTEIDLKATTPTGAAPSAAEMQQAISVLENRANGTGNTGAQVQEAGNNLLQVTIPGTPSPNEITLLEQTSKLSFRPVLLEGAYTAPVPSSTSSSPAAKASPSASPSASATSTSTASPTASSSASSTASPKASGDAVSAALASPTATTTAKATASPTATSTSTAKATATPSASASASASPTPTTAVASASGDPSEVNKATQALFNKLVCTPTATPNAAWAAAWQKSVGYTDGKDQWDANGQTVSCDSSGNKYVLGAPVFLGTQLQNESPELDTTNNQWIVNLTLDNAATKAWGTFTTKQFNTYYTGAQQGVANDQVLDETAIVLDGVVQQAPETDGALTSGTFEINGGGTTGFTEAQADQLYDELAYGQLPLNFANENSITISPQEGSSSLEAGLIAGILGLGLVVLYLFYYYRGLGLVAVSSLLLAAGLAYGSVVLLSLYQNFTMSLSAIAGLVVAIGITADSFIVYFERLRDEVREGKTLRPAVEAGWKRARRTILVSDTVQFIAAVLLYHFATSDVQGFAYTLGLTTLIDVLVVFLFTKPMVTLLAGMKFFSSGHKWSGLDPERLGAKAKWRSSTRRTVRTQRTSSPRNPSASATPKES